MPNESGSRRAGGRADGGAREGDHARQLGQTSKWEWIAAALGALLVLAAIGFMVYKGISEPDGALPEITVSVDSIAAYSDGYIVRLGVRNTGTATAAGLVIEGEIRSDTGTVERSNTTLDYVPGKAQRMAGLFFTRDPRRFKLAVRPLGYDQP